MQFRGLDKRVHYGKLTRGPRGIARGTKGGRYACDIRAILVLFPIYATLMPGVERRSRRDRSTHYRCCRRLHARHPPRRVEDRRSGPIAGQQLDRSRLRSRLGVIVTSVVGRYAFRLPRLPRHGPTYLLPRDVAGAGRTDGGRHQRTIDSLGWIKAIRADRAVARHDVRERSWCGKGSDGAEGSARWRRQSWCRPSPLLWEAR